MEQWFYDWQSGIQGGHMMRAMVLSPWTEDRNFLVVEDYPTPLGWSDATAQADEYVANGNDIVMLRGVIEPAQVTALQADNRFAVVYAADDEQEPPELTPEQLNTLRGKLANLVHSDVVELVTAVSDNPADIAAELVTACKYRPWKPGIQAIPGDPETGILNYENNLFRVTQAHTTAAHWPPDEAHSLFTRHYDNGEPWPWVQPTHAENAYPVGREVWHEPTQRVWVSQIPANTTTPGSDERYWKLRADQEPITPVVAPWFQKTPGLEPPYMEGDYVTHNGRLWLNTSDNNYYAPGVWGWTDQGPA